MGDFSILALRIKELRKSMEMTQKEFSAFAGCTAATLSAYENGSKSPSLEIIKGIAEKCNVSIDWLCGLSDKKNIGNKIETYSDVIDFLCKMEQTEIGLEVLEIPKLEDPLFSAIENIPVIAFNNMKMCHFLWDFAQVKEAKDNMAIKEHLYNLWVEDILTEYNTELQHDGIGESYEHLSEELAKTLTENQNKLNKPPQD